MTTPNNRTNAKSLEHAILGSPDEKLHIKLHDPESMTLYGAKIADILHAQSFLPAGTKESDSLKIVYTSESRAPAQVALHQKHSSAYLINAKDAVVSPELMDKLSSEDRAEIARLASLNLPEPNYSKGVFTSEDEERDEANSRTLEPIAFIALQVDECGKLISEIVTSPLHMKDFSKQVAREMQTLSLQFENC